MKLVGPQFQEVKPVVGAFVLVALFLVLALVFATARAQRWFQTTVPIEFLLPEDGSFGLRPGSGIEMLGATVGSVDELWIDDQTDRMRARATIDGDFFRFVRIDSRCVIKRKTLGLTGDAFVEINRGTKAAAEPGFTFVAVPDREPTQLMQDLSGELLPTIRAAREVIESHGVLAKQLIDPQGSAQQALRRVDNLLAAVERGDGIAGRVLHDQAWARAADDVLRAAPPTVERARQALDELLAIAKQLGADAHGLTGGAQGLLDSARISADQLPALLDDSQRVLGQVREALTQLLQLTAILPELAKTVQTEARGLDGVVAQSRGALAEVERLVAALQEHWLIRSYVPANATTSRMPPSELGGGRK
jgi:ABC-type transporter Mla subunit MlaD